ncbi:MAG: TolC family protein [Muribaculaceae bacterium]|nr:TolC family protein [Muribaculaceae bacterium]
MKSQYKACGLFAILCSLTFSAAAETITTLEDCIRTAEENNISLQTGRYSIARAKELQGTAWDIPNTGVAFAQTPADGGGPDNAVTFSQSFSFPTVYATRHSKLKEQTRLEQVKYDISRLELQKEITSQWYSLLAALETKRALERQDSIYSRFLFLAEARFKAGEAGRLEQINASRFVNENRLAINTVNKDIKAAKMRLQQWMNTDEDIVPTADWPAKVATPAVIAEEFSPYRTPSVLQLTQEGRVAEKEVSLARQQFIPEFSVALSTQAFVSGYNPYNIVREKFPYGNFMGFEVGVSVPLFFNSKRASLRAAKCELDMNRSRLEAEVQAAQTNYNVARSAYLDAKDVVDYYENQGLKDASEILRLTQVSYEKGEIGYVEYIQNIQTALDHRLSYIKIINDYNQAAIDLMFLQYE